MKSEGLYFATEWSIEKFHSSADSEPYETIVVCGNLALNVGINLLWQLLAGADANHYDNANAEIGVGDDDTAAAAAQTGLQAASNKLYKGMEATYPVTGSNQRIDFKSSFGDGEAEFAWKEFCVRNKTGGTNLNRKVQSVGTKSSPDVWTIRMRITAD